MGNSNHLISFLAKGIVNQCQKQKYLEGLSTRKLLKICERTLGGEFGLLTDKDTIYLEMIRRLKDRAGNEELIGKVIRQGNESNPVTIAEFCKKHCDNCDYFQGKEMNCAVDSEPSCALSRELGVVTIEGDHL